jgi:hypothetical protein
MVEPFQAAQVISTAIPCLMKNNPQNVESELWDYST